MAEDTSLSSRSSSPQLVFINDFSDEEEEEEIEKDGEGEKADCQAQDNKPLDTSGSKQDMIKRSSSEEGSVKFTQSEATGLSGYPTDKMSESGQFVAPVIKHGEPVSDNTQIEQGMVPSLQSATDSRLSYLTNPSDLIENPPLDNSCLQSQSNPSAAVLDESFQQSTRIPEQQTKGDNSESIDHTTRAVSQSFDSSTMKPPDLAAMKLFSRSWDSKLPTEVQLNNFSPTAVTDSPAAASRTDYNRSYSDDVGRLQALQNPPSPQPAAEQAELPMSNFSSGQFLSGQNFKKPENRSPSKQPNKNSRTSPGQRDSPPREQETRGVLLDKHQGRGSNSRTSGLQGDNSRSMLFQEHVDSSYAKGSNFAYSNASPVTHREDNSESISFQKHRNPVKRMGSLSKYPDVVPDVPKGGNCEEQMSVWGEDMVSETKELFPQYQSSPGRRRKAVMSYAYRRSTGKCMFGNH